MRGMRICERGTRERSGAWCWLYPAGSGTSEHVWIWGGDEIPTKAPASLSSYEGRPALTLITRKSIQL